MKNDENLIPKQTENLENNEIHETIQSDFLKNVSDVLLKARKNAKTAVNLAMVYAYYEIGRMIFEEEQHGENRAAYGKSAFEGTFCIFNRYIWKGIFYNKSEADAAVLPYLCKRPNWSDTV